jgi:ABC-type amino acid transport substrate-binding protein
VNLRGAIAGLAGGVGLVIGVVGVAVVAAATLVALGVPAESRADDAPAATPPPTVAAAPRPTELVVALSLADPALQAGVVRGRDVVLARGLEVELARIIAERLGIKSVRFVAVRPASRLLSSSADWDLALDSVEPSRSASSVAELTTPYLATDQAVLLRRSTARPRSLAELRTRQLCAVTGTDGARAIASLAPDAPALKVSGTTRLLQLVQTGACDAAVVDGIKAGRLIEGRKALVGPFAARVSYGSGLVVAVSRTSSIPAPAVDRVVKRLRVNGTLSRLARFWLGVDPAALPVLR